MNLLKDTTVNLELDKDKEITVKEFEDQIYIDLHFIRDPEEKELLSEIFVNEKTGKNAAFFKNFIASLIIQICFEILMNK